MQMENIGKAVIMIGAFTIIIGLVLMLIGKLGMNKLPGDIIVRRGNFTFYFPLATSILLSVLLTIILRILKRG